MAGQKRCFTKMDIPQDSRLSSGSLIKGKIYLDNSISDGFLKLEYTEMANQINIIQCSQLLCIDID